MTFSSLGHPSAHVKPSVSAFLRHSGPCFVPKSLNYVRTYIRSAIQWHALQCLYVRTYSWVAETVLVRTVGLARACVLKLRTVVCCLLRKAARRYVAAQCHHPLACTTYSAQQASAQHSTYVRSAYYQKLCSFTKSRQIFPIRT